jgi:hypothetical protein
MDKGQDRAEDRMEQKEWKEQGWIEQVAVWSRWQDGARGRMEQREWKEQGQNEEGAAKILLFQNSGKLIPHSHRQHGVSTILSVSPGIDPGYSRLPQSKLIM